MEIRLTTWEFVRLMVQCEETKKKKSTPTVDTLWTAWESIWTPLDKTLSDLIDKDFNAYSEMMMSEEVVIPNVTFDQLSATITELTNVKKAMQNALDTVQLHDEVRDAMTFEVEELATRVKSLTAMKP